MQWSVNCGYVGYVLLYNILKGLKHPRWISWVTLLKTMAKGHFSSSGFIAFLHPHVQCPSLILDESKSVLVWTPGALQKLSSNKCLDISHVCRSLSHQMSALVLLAISLSHLLFRTSLCKQCRHLQLHDLYFTLTVGDSVRLLVYSELWPCSEVE